MSRVITDAEARGVLALPPARRYEHFVREVAGAEALWGLKGDDGWLLLGDDEGAELFPVWPHERYALDYAHQQEAEETPVEIDLAAWLAQLPRLTEEGVAVAVFPLPSGAGIVVAPEQLEEDLRRELERYA